MHQSSLKGETAMRNIALFCLLGCLAVSCATNSYIDVGLKSKKVDNSLHQLFHAAPHYKLEFCGVTSRVKLQNNWFYLKMFGNQFEEWVQFAFIDEHGDSHRLEFKMIEKTSTTHISREGISRYTEHVVGLMTNLFTVPPKLNYYGSSLYQSRFVTLFYLDVTSDMAPSVMIDFEKDKSWRVVNTEDYIDVECDGYPQEGIDPVRGSAVNQ